VFQIITASTTAAIPPSCANGGRTAADEHLGFRMIDDLQAGAAEHRFRARAVRKPPVRRIVRVFVLDEIHQRMTSAAHRACARYRSSESTPTTRAAPRLFISMA
jgi:hypothetical protein